MDWVSFGLGFMAFPVVAAFVVGVYAAVSRALARDANFSKLAVSQRSSTLDFSPRLIGEIGEEALDEGPADSEPAAKAS